MAERVVVAVAPVVLGLPLLGAAGVPVDLVQVRHRDGSVEKLDLHDVEGLDGLLDVGARVEAVPRQRVPEFLSPSSVNLDLLRRQIAGDSKFSRLVVAQDTDGMIDDVRQLWASFFLIHRLRIATTGRG